MSRRRGEFEHRTSIFEGAFRAWSHLGGLDPVDLENKPASELDPLTNPIEDDVRFHSGGPNNNKRSTSGGSGKSSSSGGGPYNPDGSHRREYCYEPLPRAGLAHPYVQAILSPWLGPDADNEAIQLGLTTLRTWWQHRRKGESGSAIAALGTEKMKGVVEGYTRHFFTLAHCLIVNDKEQPPRSLHSKMKELEKLRKKGIKKRARDDPLDPTGIGAAVAAAGISRGVSTGSAASGGGGDVGAGVGGIGSAASNGVIGGGLAGGGGHGLAASLNADLTNDTLSPLERLHAAQRRQLEEAGLSTMTQQPIINIKGKCIPGKIDLPGVVDAVNRKSAQLSHRGAGGGPDLTTSGGGGMLNHSSQYGDPNTTPVVLVSPSTGENMIAMAVDGITCAHCVKIVETVLRGCNGNKSPIDGLLDAAADRDLCSVVIKIDHPSSAKRVAFEAARNLAMVGYTAAPKSMDVTCQGKTMDLASLCNAFHVVAAKSDPSSKNNIVFDWTVPCTCPDNGVAREDCTRHSQMGTRIFHAFDTRAQEVSDYVAGHGVAPGSDQFSLRPIGGDSPIMASPLNPFGDVTLQVEQQLDFAFGMEPAPIPAVPRPSLAPQQPQQPPANISYASHPPQQQHNTGAFSASGDGQGSNSNLGGSYSNLHTAAATARASLRNPSILSYGGGLRNMSLASDATFGRAMSGLSALSIDWENLDDFDLEVDHSAHINAAGGGAPNSPTRSGDGTSVLGTATGARRSSLRRSFMSAGGDKDRDAHVSFKV